MNAETSSSPIPLNTILPPRGWLALNLGELWHYRDLIYLFVRRDFVAQYKQTILGPAWNFIQPLLTTIMFTVVFGKVAKLPTEGAAPYALMVFAGLLPWQFFSTSLTESSNSLIGDAWSAGGLVHGVNHNLVGVDPRLGPLQDNGGRSQTHALLSDSPAIDTGSAVRTVNLDARRNRLASWSRLPSDWSSLAAGIKTLAAELRMARRY